MRRQPNEDNLRLPADPRSLMLAALLDRAGRATVDMEWMAPVPVEVEEITPDPEQMPLRQGLLPPMLGQAGTVKLLKTRYETQRIRVDVLFEAERGNEWELSRLGLLGQLLQFDCLFLFYSGELSYGFLAQGLNALSAYHSWKDAERREDDDDEDDDDDDESNDDDDESNGDEEYEEEEEDEEPERDPWTRLWVLYDPPLEEDFRRTFLPDNSRIAPGLYQSPMVSVIALSELEPGPGSLPLRLLAQGPIRRQALREMFELTADQFPRQPLAPLLEAIWRVLPEDSDVPEVRSLLLDLENSPFLGS